MKKVPADMSKLDPRYVDETIGCQKRQMKLTRTSLVSFGNRMDTCMNRKPETAEFFTFRKPGQKQLPGDAEEFKMSMGDYLECDSDE